MDRAIPGMVCVVPARMSSSRFPGKPLVDIDGIPLVVRSAQRGRDAECFERVVIASEDREIVTVAREHGFEALLTPSFETGTDRVAWAGRELGARHVVNLQGDEPLFPLDLLRDLARRLPSDPDALWTAADLGLTEDDRADEDVVKIRLSGEIEAGGTRWSRPAAPVGRGNSRPAELQVDGARDLRNRENAVFADFDFPVPVALEGQSAKTNVSTRDALDFHRVLPPGIEGDLAVHVGVYAGSTALLGRFSDLPQTDRERSRRIEPLRALDHGIAVRAVIGRWDRAAVDRKEHISRVLEVLRRGE